MDVALTALPPTGGQLSDVVEELHSREDCRISTLTFTHRQIDATFPCRVDGEVIPGIRMPHHAGAGVGRQYPLQPALRCVTAVGHNDHSGVDRVSDAHSTAMVNRDPAGTTGGI